jgi:hypothetical protein
MVGLKRVVVCVECQRPVTFNGAGLVDGKVIFQIRHCPHEKCKAPMFALAAAYVADDDLRVCLFPTSVTVREVVRAAGEEGIPLPRYGIHELRGMLRRAKLHLELELRESRGFEVIEGGKARAAG